ncbi:unnamed protein product [Mycena citricolor]|uniref:Uncharacterized protein n=1 Tax=Mycena citricolor TaxID=2018698 RepID=A0AAD2HYE5_9AGAR|nr:unnamed protein product [Mycena citricolor]
MPGLGGCPDEVLQLIFFELADPTAFAATARRFHSFSQEPYVRAQYFITRYGPLQALYFALGRGRLLTRRVLDIFLTSGVHLSRYLVQVAFHHYFHAHSHPIKSPTWTRKVPLDVFSYFLELAAEKYGDIPRGKGEDDGSLFATFLKEAKLPPESQTVTWTEIADIFQTYHARPSLFFWTRYHSHWPLNPAFSHMQLPTGSLWMTRYAVASSKANHMSHSGQYRDFVFRKMFERHSTSAPGHADEIVDHVRELCNGNSTMYITRTVAAEVCLEAKTNDAGYLALKRLDQTGDLAFSLRDLVTDIIKLFMGTRAITTTLNCQILTLLYHDFLAPKAPEDSVDASVRRAMFLTIFAADPPIAPQLLSERLDALKLGPFTLKDASLVLLSAFVEKPGPVMDYVRRHGIITEDGGATTRKVSPKDLHQLARDVAVQCLVFENKGKTLKRLCASVPSVKTAIAEAVLLDHRIAVETIQTGERVNARLARLIGVTTLAIDSADQESSLAAAGADLGFIGLDTLTTMIRRDEAQGIRRRYRWYYTTAETAHPEHRQVWHLLIQYCLGYRSLADTLSVAQWIKTEFGHLSHVTAVFLQHAIINCNSIILLKYLRADVTDKTVPVTLQHFRILASTENSYPDFYLYDQIKQGAAFYVSEAEYLSASGLKTESDASLPAENRKRPRRSAATGSYVVPDSDDEMIAEDVDDAFAEYRRSTHTKKRGVLRADSPLQMWVAALSELHKAEQQKFREKKRRMEQEAGKKVRASKSDFFRSLSTNLKTLRELDAEQQRTRISNGENIQDSEDDDEDWGRTTRKRRKIAF